MKKKPQILWFARGGGIAKCGPFKTQIEATNAMRLVKRKAQTCIVGKKAEIALFHDPGQDQEFPPDIFVWPEEV